MNSSFISSGSESEWFVEIACEQALHLGDIVKSRCATGTREETRKRGAGRALARIGGCCDLIY